MSSTSIDRSVAVLGLGRLGAAIAGRLVDRGWTVTGWSRSGAELAGVRTAPRAADAVGGARLVILCLFDGPACREVLTAVAGALAEGATVVNVSTTSPGEATELLQLANDAGAGYVHAPVIGSVTPARNGALTLLVGGTEEAVASTTPLLAELGQPFVLDSPHRAAAAKLLANGALGTALLGVRAASEHAAALGLDRDQALEVLARGPLGGLVSAKRAWLVGEAEAPAADFTVAALAKDLTLLADAAPQARPLSAQVTASLRSGVVDADDDIAVLMRPSPPSDLPHGLSLAPGIAADPEVLAPLVHYVRGHATGDPTHFAEAFLPSAHVEGVRDGEFVSWTLADYTGLFRGTPAADETSRRRRVDRLDTHGTVGTATMTLAHGADVFTDVFVLARVGGRWWIANKAYHRHPATT